MADSRQIARVVGPTLIALSVTEAVNFDIFAGNAAPVVYLNGTLLFVAGLSIVQAHNRWGRSWPLLVTLTGWFLLLAGLYRMLRPAAPQESKGIAADTTFAVLFAVGGVLTYMAYRRLPKPPAPSDER